MAVSFVPLHKVVVAAVVKRTKDEFSLPIRLSLKDELEDVVKDAAPADRQGQFAALFLDSVDIMEGGDAGGASGSFRSYALSRRGGGVRSYVREPNEQEDGATGEEDGWGGQYDTMLKMNLVPVKFNFTFWYGTTDLSELMDMLVSWAFARQKRRLDFKLKYMALDMDISCRPSGSMSVARKSPDTDTGGYLLYEGQLEVYGYVNRDDARDTLRRPITLHAELDAELREKSLARMLAGIGQDDKAVSLSTTVGGASGARTAVPSSVGVSREQIAEIVASPALRTGSARWSRDRLPEDVLYEGDAGEGVSSVRILEADDASDLDEDLGGVVMARISSDFGDYEKGEVLLLVRDQVRRLEAGSSGELAEHADADGFAPIVITADFSHDGVSYKEGEVVLNAPAQGA